MVLRLTTGGDDWASEVLSDDCASEVLSDDCASEAFSSSVVLVDAEPFSGAGSSFTSSEQALRFEPFLLLALCWETDSFSPFLPDIMCSD